jgi:very-short-patch-repair endonuclease
MSAERFDFPTMARALILGDKDTVARKTREGLELAMDPKALIFKGLIPGMDVVGEKFRRQVPMGPYVVDFVSHRSRLIVELDGGQHAVQMEHDRERTRWLESRGYRVIRFWNNQMLTETEPVLEAIALALAPSP